MYVDFRDKNQVFDSMFGSWDTALNLSFDGRTERIAGQLVTGSYFPALGVGAALGRVLSKEDDQVNGGHPVVVLSYRYWLTRFAGNPGVIGKKLSVNGYPMTVVGVSQAGFDGTDPANSPQIRLPILMEEQIDAPSDNLEDRRFRWVDVFGRLKPGETMEQAKAGAICSLRPKRAAVIDLDVHQGDGMAHFFEHDPTVLTISLHGANNFPFHKQRTKSDVELADKTGDEEYLHALDSVLPRALEFVPEIVFYLSGVDALASDVLGRLALTQEGLKVRDERVIGTCVRGKLPLVITLGGGYSKPIELTVEAHANTFRVAAGTYKSILKPSGTGPPRFSSL